MYDLRLLASSIWTQGVKSDYRRAYWDFLGTLVHRHWNSPAKMWMGLSLLLTAEHFLIYSRHVADELERDCAVALGVGNAAARPNSAEASPLTC